MDSGTAEWWRRHGWTIGLLLVAFGFALAIRTIWQYPVIQQFGALYTYAGGSDSYYHSRVMTYIIQTHRNLVYDPMLKFPVGSVNPREPLFDWMNAILGIVFAPLFGGNAVNAGAWFLDFQSPFWAALSVFPLYLVGREVSGRRTGLIAALVYPFFSASIDSSTFGYADYLSFYTFFLLVVLYAYLRTLKAVGHRRWVESYRHPRQFLAGVRGFVRNERTAVKWSVFTGVSLGAFGLAWQGYSYAIIVVAFTVLVAMLIERIRHVDSFGLYISSWIIGLVAFPMAAPYYLVQTDIWLFLVLPAILFFGTLLLLLPFLLLRDVPWVFSIPALIGVVGVGLLALRFAAPALFTDAITGNGYFVKTLVYSTVAEAQAPSIDALIVGYGVVTFFLAFAGLALFGYHLVHQRFRRYLIAFLIFAIVSIYLPISAAKFFLVASPAFALLSAEGIHRLLDVGGYPQLRRAVASLTDRSGSFSAFRKSFKARHVLVLVLAVGILLPNIWISIDAGIPSNTKAHAAIEIDQSIPSWLKLNASAPASNYLGAAGSGLDTSNEYDSAGYSWLAQQDTNLPEPKRPAVVAWWDYGFQTIDQGQHPSVADNFQNGIDPAGQFLLAQNESLAIGVLATTLLQAEILLTRNPTLPTPLNAILAADGVNVTALHQILDNPTADYNLVVRNPKVYGPVDASTITGDNAMYLVSSYFLADHLPLTAVARAYDDLEAYTGWSIGYALTDSRTFPFSGSDTGIFYAPADLTGRVINSAGVPTSYFNVSVLGSDGNTYPLGPLPAGVSAVQYSINYSAPFYNTMLYRIYIGYNGTDAGQSGGIPGLTGAAESDPIEPGWMLQHFEVVYQTAYVCPGVKNASTGSACMFATNRPTAIAVASETGGTDDLSAVSYFEGGESMLAYYPGLTLNGRLVLPNGAPVTGVRVTVDDGWGIPHMTNVTNANGAFSLVLPPGNDTLKVTYGSLDQLTMTDANTIASIKYPVSNALGFDTTPAPLFQTFTIQNAKVSGLVYWNATGNSSYVPISDPVVRGAQVVLTGPTGVASYSATTDASGTFDLPTVPPGNYDVTVRYQGQTYNQSAANVSSGSSVSLTLALSPGGVEGAVLSSGTGYSGATVVVTNATGVTYTATTNLTGGFHVTGVPAGTYTVSATGVDPLLTSARVRVSVAPTGTAWANLTLSESGTAEVSVEAGGAGLSGAQVTFSPFVSFDDRSSSALGTVLSASTNATFASSGASGVAVAALPVGLYSVSALARVNSVLYTALGLLNVTGPGATPTLSLDLTPARTVTVTVPGATSSSIRTAVLAYAATGGEVTAWAGTGGVATLELPSGSYSFLAVRGGLAPGATSTVGLATESVAGATAFTLTVGPAVSVHFTVGTPGSGGQVLPAGNATVVLSVGTSGPSVTAFAEANGTVGFVVPATLPGASGGYCVSASAFGFASGMTCGFTAPDLANLSTFDLAVDTVPVTLQVVGLPAMTSVTVTLTGESAATESFSATGAPTFAFDLTPGIYGVGAEAVVGRTTVYLPSSTYSTTIPLGATYTNLTLVVVPEINASGPLSVPTGLPLQDVRVALASPLLNLKVSGSAYTKLFRATPGTYTATVTASVEQATYVNVSRVTLYPNGSIWPTLVLASPGVTANLTFQSPRGAAVAVNTSVTLVSETGLTTVESTLEGAFSVTLPPGLYRVYANTTAVISGPNGTYYTSWTTGLSATCTFLPTTPPCTVTLTGTPLVVNVTGTLVAPGSGPVAGTVQLVGPYPSTNLTVLAAPSGTFSAALLPGAYSLYAVSTAGGPLAAFGRLLALPASPSSVTVPLGPTWTDALGLAVDSSGSVTASEANLSVRDVFGDVTTFPDVAVGSVLDLALPVGTYVVSATGPGARNDVAGVASASATVALEYGNSVTNLVLNVPVAATVSASLAGPSALTVAAGGQVTFAFTVRANGNVPVTIHPVGSPATWAFAFSFANATLSPGASLSGEVHITVPYGTYVAHAPVGLVLELPNGTEAGAVTPAPVVNVLAYNGLTVGTSSSALPEVGATHAILPFYVLDSGNTEEVAQLSLVDAPRLASDGWTTSWVVSGAASTSGQVTLGAGENTSVSLNLTASSSATVAPGTVTVQVALLNSTSPITATVVLSVPRPAVATSSGTLLVTGPSVTSGPSPVPVWLVPLLAFVPALLLVLGVVTYRWWRTRRWTRR